MDPTIKLYDENAYETFFTAQILEVRETECPEEREIVLNRTLFFPEEGGQTPDRGILGGLEVTDVQIRNGVIFHRVRISGNEEDGIRLRKLTAGESTEGHIDWEHRFDNMQNHSGEHLLCGIAHRDHGCENVGFHLSSRLMTMDLDRELDGEQILELERKANRAVWENRTITAEYPSGERLCTMTYRSKLELTENVRIVTIDGYDVCACCAPHVRRTGEIGMIKILRWVRNKGGVRLTVACGERALSEAQCRQKQAEEISAMTSRKQEELTDAVRRLYEELERQKKELGILRRKLLEEQMRQTDPSLRNVVLFAEKLDPVVQREAVNRMCAKHAGFCGIFSDSGEGEYRFIIGSGTEKEDVRRISSFLREHGGAKGGGKPEMVQGSICGGEEEIRNLLRKL